MMLVVIIIIVGQSENLIESENFIYMAHIVNSLKYGYEILVFSSRNIDFIEKECFLVFTSCYVL